MAEKGSVIMSILLVIVVLAIILLTADAAVSRLLVSLQDGGILRMALMGH